MSHFLPIYHMTLDETLLALPYSLGSGVVSWQSCKQCLVADSTCYAEYTTLYKSLHKAIFLWQLLDCLRFPCWGSTPIYCDNDTTTRLAEDQVLHSKVKHIRVKLHTIHNYIALGDIQVPQVQGEDNIMDILTKPLSCSNFLWLCGYLGLYHTSTHSVWEGATTRRSLWAMNKEEHTFNTQSIPCRELTTLWVARLDAGAKLKVTDPEEQQ